MKAKKFIDKAVDAIEDWLYEQDLSEDYTIYWKLKNGEPVVKLMYPDGSIHKYNLESYRQLHKESDLSFKNIAEKIIDEQIMDEMLAYERYERNAAQMQQETEHCLEMPDRETQIRELDRELLVQDLIHFLAENRDRIEAAGLFPGPFIVETLTINSESKEVLVPDLLHYKDYIGMNAAMGIETEIRIPVLEIDDIEEVLLADCDSRKDRLCAVYLNRLLNEPVTGLETIFKDDVLDYVYPRLVPPRDLKASSEDGNVNLYEVFGIRLSNHAFVEIASWMVPMPLCALDGCTDEEIKKRAYENQSLAVSELSPDICVVTDASQNCRFGASAIHNPQLPDILQRKFGTDEVLIIPSSVHECIVTPDTEEMRKTFAGLLQIVNRTLNPNEVLYDEMLCLNLRTRQVTLADADTEQEHEAENEDGRDYDEY